MPACMPDSMPDSITMSRTSLLEYSHSMVIVVRPSASLKRDRVQAGLAAARHTFVDLGEDELLVGHDLAVLAMEAHLEAAVGLHHVAPLPADLQVDVGQLFIVSVI